MTLSEADHPRAGSSLDALLLFLHSFLFARSGSRDWQQEQFAYLTELAPRYGNDWYFLGHYAFAHHALDRYEESRQLAERALASYPLRGGTNDE